jgi:hypothetical protein
VPTVEDENRKGPISLLRRRSTGQWQASFNSPLLLALNVKPKRGAVVNGIPEVPNPFKEEISRVRLGVHWTPGMSSSLLGHRSTHCKALCVPIKNNCRLWPVHVAGIFHPLCFGMKRRCKQLKSRRGGSS